MRYEICCSNNNQYFAVRCGTGIAENGEPPELTVEPEKPKLVNANGTKVKYFDGREKTRDVYMAVVDYTLGGRELQQCADTVMRLRAEYLYSVGKHDEILAKRFS